MVKKKDIYINFLIDVINKEIWNPICYGTNIAANTPIQR